MARLLVALLLVLTVPFAHAQDGGGKQLPITTGTTKTAMDAPDTNSDLESYAHAPAVQSLARHLGLSTNRASRLFEDFNSGVVILVVLYYLLKYLPGKFRARRERLDRELVEARAATEDAQARLGEIETRLTTLGAEVEALRREAAESAAAEHARMQAATEEERQRIVRTTEIEIRAIQASAERGLKRYASDLAVDRAAERIRLTPDGDRAATDQAMMDEFLQSLAGEIGKRGQN